MESHPFHLLQFANDRILQKHFAKNQNREFQRMSPGTNKSFPDHVLSIAFAVGWVIWISAFTGSAEAREVQATQAETWISPQRMGTSEESTTLGATTDPAGTDPDREHTSGSGDAKTDDTTQVKHPASDALPTLKSTVPQDKSERGFQWRAALNQSYLFLGIQHTFRFATEPSTRAELKGPFFSDYFDSVKNLRGWRDGDEFYVNYVGHTLQGAVTGFIYVHNDPAARRLEVGLNKAYVTSRLKAAVWSAVHSLQFEIGPISEASLGNVGLEPGEKSNHPLSYVDLVVTPVLGTAWVVAEDLLDRHVIRRIEGKTQNRLIHILARSLLNPSRTLANLLRGQEVWYRDDRYLRRGPRP